MKRVSSVRGAFSASGFTVGLQSTTLAVRTSNTFAPVARAKFTVLLETSSVGKGLNRSLRRLQERAKQNVLSKRFITPSTCGVLSLGKSLPGMNDGDSRLYSYPASLDGRWAMIDTKPVWVPVPTFWQRIAYYLWKLCGIVVGVAACAAITFALYMLPNPAKWALLLGYPVTFWVSYKMYIQGAYNSVQRWAELRAQCTEAPFSQAIMVPGVHECLTPRELRKKMLREVMGKEYPIEFVAMAPWNFAAFQQAGMFSLKEIEEIAEFTRSLRNIKEQYNLEKGKIDSAFGDKIKHAKERKDQRVIMADNKFYNSSEIRLNREIDSTYEEKHRLLRKKREDKIAHIRQQNISDAEKGHKIAAAERRYNDKLQEIREIRDIKLAANSSAVIKRTQERDDEVRLANQVFEDHRKKLYQQEGMAQKYENLQTDYKRNMESIQEQWQKYVDNTLVPAESVVRDMIEPTY